MYNRSGGWIVGALAYRVLFILVNQEETREKIIARIKASYNLDSGRISINVSTSCSIEFAERFLSRRGPFSRGISLRKGRRMGDRGERKVISFFFFFWSFSLIRMEEKWCVAASIGGKENILKFFKRWKRIIAHYARDDVGRIIIDVKDYRSYRKILYCTIKIIRLRIFLRSVLFLSFDRYVERLMRSDKQGDICLYVEASR